MGADLLHLSPPSVAKARFSFFGRLNRSATQTTSPTTAETVMVLTSERKQESSNKQTLLAKDWSYQEESV
jgi:hypothetical protein